MSLMGMGLALLLLVGAWGQATAPVPSDVARTAGTDAESGIAYVLISIDGKRLDAHPVEFPPRLTAQCFKTPEGKMKFELLADMGDVKEIRFVPPWVKKGDNNPPVLVKTMVTMDFLGYMKVKPVKRQWISIDGLKGEMKYSAPGMQSANLEEIMYYMQFLKALPTLRLTIPSDTKTMPATAAEFDTAKWQAQVKAEPLCWASAL